MVCRNHSLSTQNRSAHRWPVNSSKHTTGCNLPPGRVLGWSDALEPTQTLSQSVVFLLQGDAFDVGFDPSQHMRSLHLTLDLDKILLKFKCGYFSGVPRLEKIFLSFLSIIKKQVLVDVLKRQKPVLMIFDQAGARVNLRWNCNRIEPDRSLTWFSRRYWAAPNMQDWTRRFFEGMEHVSAERRLIDLYSNSELA
jgi:hypothetical protein